MNMLKNKTTDRKVDVILGVAVDSTPKEELLKRVLSFIKIKKQFFIVTPNPEIILLSQKDTTLRNALNSADISLPDGVGLVFAARMLNLKIKSRIPGRKFMVNLFKLAHTHKLKVYLLGGDRAVISGSLTRIKNEYPSIIAAGAVGPKLGLDANPADNTAIQVQKALITTINAFKPDILIIGFGAPKQEKWFSNNREKLSVAGAMVVGGSLDVYSRQKKASPEILNRLGLEWMWRLLTEPKRLSRIINAVFIFPISIFREQISSLLR